MREILFKAKRKDNGEWVEGYYVKTGEASYIVVPYSQADISGAEGSNIEVDADTICQYTGLTDKNGKKIWEGDIVKDNVVFGPVVWDERYVQFMIDDECDGHQDYSDWWQKVEVISNIFDNKDLLEN